MAYPKNLEDNMQKRTHTDTEKFTDNLISLAVEVGMLSPKTRVLKALAVGGEAAVDLLKEFRGKKKEQAKRLLIKARKVPDSKMRAIKEPSPVRMSAYGSQRSTKRMNEMLDRAADTKKAMRKAAEAKARKQ